VTNVLQFHFWKRSFCSESAVMATRASGLKILVSVVRFRPGHWKLLRFLGTGLSHLSLLSQQLTLFCYPFVTRSGMAGGVSTASIFEGSFKWP